MKKLLLVAGFLFLAFQISFAQTNVSGGIYSNTTWTKANSPYIVTDTVVVFPGVTLTIQPGVTVKFDDSTMLELRQATLIANGTRLDSITFTSNSSSPTPGIYGGINCYIGNFSFCNFYYAYYGVFGDSISNIRNSNFKYNMQGFYGRKAALIDSCNFISNTNIGLSVDATSYGNTVSIASTISNSEINGNQIGMGLSNNISSLNVVNCNISHNIFYGITFDYAQVFIENCIINNNGYGLFESGFGVSNNIIERCKIDSNSIGFYFFYDSQTEDSIAFCEIQNNTQGIAFAAIENSASTIVGNIIQNNEIGIADSDGALIKAYCNKFANNSTYDFINGTSANISIADNYWGTSDSSIIASRIYDGYDNINLGLVNFLPVDTTKCYLTGCNLLLSATTINATCDTCHNGSATVVITNGSAPYTITWFTSPIQSGATATHLAPGTYSVCVVDANGCSACYGGVHIDSTNCGKLSVSSGSVNATCSTCSDGSAWVSVSGGTLPYHYTWYSNPFQGTDTATNLPHGNYHVCISDKYGCSVCDSVTVGTGNCSAHFDLYPDSAVQHHYFATNMASGAAPIHFLWSWGDGTTDTIPFPTHTYTAAGYYTICLTITDAVGCTDEYCVSYYLMRTDGSNGILSVQVVSGLTTGTQNLNGDNSFSAYPNPASNKLNLVLSGNSETSIRIYNVIGVEEVNSIVQGTNATIDISNLTSGLYIIEALSGNNISRQKFVKR